jgi:enterochelin esterase-like enzyme
LQFFIPSFCGTLRFVRLIEITQTARKWQIFWGFSRHPIAKTHNFRLISIQLGKFCLIGTLIAACSPTVQAAMPTAEKPAPTAVAATATSLPTPTPSPVPTSDPSPSPTPNLQACLQKGGRFVLGQVKASVLAAPVEYRVYLPPCYDQHTTQRYPVLYLIHGQSFTDDQWQRLGAGTTADRLIASGQAAPFLMVMPRDRIWTDPDKDPFDVALVNTLIPTMDSLYRTLADRQHRAVGGMSRGAGWAAHLGMTHPELFGEVGMHSLAIFWTDVPSIKKWLDAIPADEMPRFYLDIGNNDRPEIMESTHWFESLLDQRNIPHEWHFFTGYHDEKYWQAHVEQYLLWYTQPWKGG